MQFTFEAEYPTTLVHLSHFRTIMLPGASQQGALLYPSDKSLNFDSANQNVLYKFAVEANVYSLYARVSCTKGNKGGFHVLAEHVLSRTFTYLCTPGVFKWVNIADLDVDDELNLRVYAYLPFSVVDRFALESGNFDANTIESSSNVDKNVAEECVVSSDIIAFQGICNNSDRWTLTSAVFYSADDNNFVHNDKLNPKAKLGFLHFAEVSSAVSKAFTIGKTITKVNFSFQWFSTSTITLSVITNNQTFEETVSSDETFYSINLSSFLSEEISIAISTTDAQSDMIVYDLTFENSLCGDGVVSCLEQCDEGSIVEPDSKCHSKTCECFEGTVPPECSVPKCTSLSCAKCLDDELCASCDVGFTGDDCKNCAPGWSGYPDCYEDLKECSSLFCSGCIAHEKCSSCTSNDVVGNECLKCRHVGPKYAEFPNCSDCADTSLSYPSCTGGNPLLRGVLTSIFCLIFVASLSCFVFFFVKNWKHEPPEENDEKENTYFSLVDQ